MVRAGKNSGSDQQKSDKKPIGVRLDPETKAALMAEADREGMTLSAYCRTLLERHLAGESLTQLRSDIAEVREQQDRHQEQLQQVSIGVFYALRTLLLNLTDLDENTESGQKLLNELRRRVVGR